MGLYAADCSFSLSIIRYNCYNITPPQKKRKEKKAYLFQDSFIEELLQLFIAIVDAELFKAVHLEVLWNIEISTFSGSEMALSS